eukprot:13741997-Alexandrium_andersonii.AAC.1
MLNGGIDAHVHDTLKDICEHAPGGRRFGAKRSPPMVLRSDVPKGTPPRGAIWHWQLVTERPEHEELDVLSL